MGAMKAEFWYAFAAATTLVFGAAYTLWMYKRVIFGPVANEHVHRLRDINLREFLVLGLLAVAVLWMGLYPKPFAEVLHVAVDELVAQVSETKVPTP
jgi:NADH-quinone oxidoreductase subunit M